VYCNNEDIELETNEREQNKMNSRGAQQINIEDIRIKNRIRAITLPCNYDPKYIDPLSCPWRSAQDDLR